MSAALRASLLYSTVQYSYEVAAGYMQYDSTVLVRVLYSYSYTKRSYSYPYTYRNEYKMTIIA